MVLSIAALAVSVASLLAAIASVYVAQQSELVSQRSLEQAEKVSSRDQENWRQRTWFDLYLKASEAYDFFDFFQKKYVPPHPSWANNDYPEDYARLIMLMRQTHSMAGVFPINPVIDKLFVSTAVFDDPSEALSPERLGKVFDAVQDLREQSLLNANVLGSSNQELTVQSHSLAHGNIEMKHGENLWNRYKWIVEIVGVILLAVYTGYTINIYRANHGTLLQIQKQTKLMQTQVEGEMAAIITKQFVLTWPKEAHLAVILNNRGRVVGSDIHADFHLAEISLADQRVIGSPLPDWEFSVPELGPSQDMPVERGTDLNISQEELKGHPMPRAVRLTGTFTYSNGFSQKSELACYYVLGAVEFTNKLGAIQETHGPTVISCDALPEQIAFIRQNQKDTGSK